MSDQGMPHVLVVEAMLLECEGFRCSEAADGEQAIRAVQSGPAPDVMLLDYRMPRLSGGETLSILRTLDYRIPAVLLTAAMEADEIGLRYGFDAVLRKPVGPEQLFSTLRSAIARMRGTTR